MRKTLIMFSLFFIIVLCSFHSPVFAQDPGIPDTVRFFPWGTYVPCPPCTGRAVVPMVVVNDESLRMISIPLKWTGPLSLDTVIFKGKGLTFEYLVIDNNAKTVFLVAGALPGDPPVPPGLGILAYLHFTVHDTGMATLDTGLTAVPDIFCFADDRPEQFLPHFFSSDFHIVAQSTLPGDVNSDGRATISDVVWLINYLFKGGPAPSYTPSGDVNTDGETTVADVIYFINYLFKGGPCLGGACYN